MPLDTTTPPNTTTLEDMGIPADTTMRRVVVSAGSIDVVTAQRPHLGRHEALIQTLVAGVCGSDIHAARGRHPFIPLPYHPGHEVVGVVAEIGSDATSVIPGQRVIVEPTLPCWTCKMCRTGRSNLCENLQFFGCGYKQGGMAEFFTIAADRLHVLPDDLDDRIAVLIEPLSTPVHAARIAGGVAGKAVAILGSGTIGLLMLAVVRAQGARRVAVTDARSSKRELALSLGADAAVDAMTGDVVSAVRDALGESADVVFDCVAIESTVRQAVALASKGGTVVVVGVPSSEVTVPLPIVQDHQIRIQGSATYLPEDYAESMSLLRQGVVHADPIITATLPLEAAAEAFRQASTGEAVKVLVTVDSGAAST